MRGTGSMATRLLVVIFATTMAAGAVTAVWAQSPPSRVGANEPESVQEQGESAQHVFPPLAVDSRIYDLGDPWLSKLADDIADGSASLVERRAYYRLYPRLYPFTHTIPDGWRKKARMAIEALTPLSYKRAIQDGKAGSSTTWTPLGPQQYYNGSDKNSGRATAIWVDPTDKNHILLGLADGGVWKTTDQGGSWTPIFDGEATQSIGSIAVDPNDANVIYVGTGEGNFNADAVGGMGMYKSTDGGTSWSLLTLPAWRYSDYYHSIHRIVVDPNNSNYVYAAIDGGLIYSTNSGTSWTLTTCGTTTGPWIAMDVVAVGNPTYVYVAFGYPGGSSDNGIYRATSSSLTSWTKIAPSGSSFTSTSLGRITLVSAPSNSNVLYALTESTSSGGSKRIYYTSTASTTASWTGESTTNYCSSQGWYDMTGAVDPNNAAHLVVGGLDDYVSSNNGSSITKVSSWNSAGNVYSHADHHFLAIPDASTIYDANDGGFFIGTVTSWSTASVTWTNANAGLNTLQFYGMAQHPTDPTHFQGGLQDNGQAYFNGSTWDQVQGGDGGQSAWDQTNGSYAYQEYVYAYITRNPTMTTNPTNFTCIQNYGKCSCSYGCVPDSQTAFIAPFTLDANNQNTIYTGSKYVYVNTNARGGNTWTTSGTDLVGTTSDYVTAIHSASNNGVSGTVYAGTSNGKLWISTNSGSTWTERDSGLSGASITSIATNPTDGTQVLVTVSGYGGSHVYRSTDSGLHWTDITGSIPAEPADAVAVDPNATTMAYVGTDYGLFENQSVWTGSTWSSIQYNLPAVGIDGIAFNVVTGNLRVATHGRGIWELGGSTAPIVNASSGWQQNLTNTSGALGSSVLVKFWEAGGASTGNSGTVTETSMATTYSTGYRIESNWGAAGVSGVPSSTSARTAVLYSDVNGGSARFLVMSAGPTLGRYNFDTITNGSSNAGGCTGTGNAPCSASIPQVVSGSRAANDANGMDYTVNWTPLSNLAGYYDTAPGNNIITGIAVYYWNSATPPTADATGYAVTNGNWVLAAGGTSPARAGYVSWGSSGTDPGTLTVYIPDGAPSTTYVALDVLFDRWTPGSAGFATRTDFLGADWPIPSPTPAGVFASFNASVLRKVVSATWRSNVESGIASYEVYVSGHKNRNYRPVESTLTAPKGDSQLYTVSFPYPKSVHRRVLFLKVAAIHMDGTTTWSQRVKVKKRRRIAGGPVGGMSK